MYVGALTMAVLAPEAEQVSLNMRKWVSVCVGTLSRKRPFTEELSCPRSAISVAAMELPRAPARTSASEFSDELLIRFACKGSRLLLNIVSLRRL